MNVRLENMAKKQDKMAEDLERVMEIAHKTEVSLAHLAGKLETTTHL